MAIGKPIISSRLPKAFSQPKHLTHKKLQDHQDLTAMNEFKNVKKLLSPIKQVSPESTALRKVINKLANFPKLANPAHTLGSELLVQSILRLEEMVTLGPIRSNYQRSGVIRKSIHVPTLKLYSSKEFPVGTILIRQRLIETLKTWQSLQKGNRYLVEVCSTFWNTPEGCVTILMEHMAGESLSRLCESIGAIPEKVLKSITKRIIAGLAFFNKKSGTYGGLDLNHVLFTRDGKIKLSLALNSRLQGKEDKRTGVEDDVFDLGCLLINASVGGSEWTSEILGIKGECCLFHTAVINAEIPYLIRFSREFSGFLCLVTRYDRESRGKIQDLNSHEWFKAEEFVGPDLNLKELLDMSVVGSKDTSFDKQIENLCEQIKFVMSECQEFRSLNKANVKELALELGTSFQFLNDKIEKIFSNEEQ